MATFIMGKDEAFDAEVNDKLRYDSTFLRTNRSGRTYLTGHDEFGLQESRTYGRYHKQGGEGNLQLRRSRDEA
jgi:hypothetical protein